MVAIADCVGFYAAWHQSTEPWLQGVPVVSLSNNDGCMIALSPEAKALGASRTEPWHFVMDKYVPLGMVAYSSNYREYQAMNKRLMKILARFVPRLETYSIDECWMDMSGVQNLSTLVPFIINETKKLTGIQIRIGVAPTKTLAKVAIHLAKQDPTNSFIINNQSEIDTALQRVAVEDMWNVGRQYANMLHRNGIHTAARLAITPEWWVRKKMTVVGWRTQQELRGNVCLKLVEVMDPKKNIGVGRSFKKTTSDAQQLIDASTFYGYRLAEKLREEKLVATVLQVSLRTNKWKVDTAQHQPRRIFHLDTGINNMIDVTRYARHAVKSIIDENLRNKVSYKYMKIEVFASGLLPENENQIVINDSYAAGSKNRLSRVIDDINLQMGKGKVCFANNLKAWKHDNLEAYIMRQQYPSPKYFTDWNESPLLR